MPHRAIVAKELGAMLNVLSHPCRLQIIEELRGTELDVNSLQAILGISHSGVSQHLSVLRAHRLVAERREGRRVFYRLLQPELATWLVSGLDFLEGNREASDLIRTAVQTARAQWSDPQPS